MAISCGAGRRGEAMTVLVNPSRDKYDEPDWPCTACLYFFDVGKDSDMPREHRRCIVRNHSVLFQHLSPCQSSARTTAIAAT